ncbi:MAG: hypothetical protein J6W69_08695 [Bacteroidales bacterium]|nr:hypothetical protein [Bacteroidales bacterium]
MRMNPFYTWLTPLLAMAVTVAAFLLLMSDEPTALFWINLGYTLVLEGLFFGWLLWGRKK